MDHLTPLTVKDLVVEHLKEPVGIDCAEPRFGWKLESPLQDTVQSAYRLRLFFGHECAADTGIVKSSQSIEVTIPDWQPLPMTAYDIQLTVWDNREHTASAESFFETGRMGIPFRSSWVEPEQLPTPSSMETHTSVEDMADPCTDGARDYHEFRPAQYIRIPFTLKKEIRQARVYATAHGLYRLDVNGARPDGREFAPENSAYDRLLFYQTYDITRLLRRGENVIGAVLADGWWAGRVGVTGDSCQYGNTLGLLLDAEIEYYDGDMEFVSGEQGVSSEGPIVFSDLFVGEKYDDAAEMEGWSAPGFPAEGWKPVHTVPSPAADVSGQPYAPVKPLKIFRPARIFTAPNGDTILDAGQVLAGQLEFSLVTDAGHTITLEHTEILDEKGNFCRNILGVNKEQTDIYITKNGLQTYRPAFTYHGFRYVRITGWPERISVNNFKVYALTSQMEDIGSFCTSDPRLNQLQSNIWWSQVSNTLSIPTDCPQREKAGGTGDILAFAPTLCFNRNADAFLTAWMANVRAEQRDSGAIPMIVPYLKAYRTFLGTEFGTDTSCGWGDAVITVPYAVYRAYGDKRILEENYAAMTRWMDYIAGRAENFHPEGYENYDEERKARDRYLWNTDFHFGDWLIPSLVLNNPDAGAMKGTAYATMGAVGPAFYAFSARHMREIARILGKKEDEAHYGELYEHIRQAFIAEYVHEDGSMDADFQGIYVIALSNGLVTDEIRPRMAERLCRMIRTNGDRLDTGFLSVPFLMDVLCGSGHSDTAFRLLFQTACPSWLYEVEKGATTMWESWGAVAEDGTVSSYSYNHYAFGCIGDWMYRTLGGLSPLEPGYRKFLVSPHFDCGLSSVSLKEECPYGTIEVSWKIVDGRTLLHVTVPANTSAVVSAQGLPETVLGSGNYDFLIH